MDEKLQDQVNRICLDYTAAKYPALIVDTPTLLRRIGEEYGELAEAVALTLGSSVKDSIAEELADMLNTILMLCSHLDLDAETIILAKLQVLRDRTLKLRTTGSY